LQKQAAEDENMGHVYRIVVGSDLEQDGDAALAEALRIGTKIGAAELHIVHVLDRVGDRDMQTLASALDAGLARLRDRSDWAIDAEQGVDVRLHVRFGDVAQTLEQVAVDYDADLLVVGTHARRGVARALLGSVAESLVRNARLPVLVARPKDFQGIARTPSPDRGRPGAALHQDQVVSEAIRVGPRVSHISGLV
jgi:nucleotide-binding universal stress UspA family protein